MVRSRSHNCVICTDPQHVFSFPHVPHDYSHPQDNPIPVTAYPILPVYPQGVWVPNSSAILAHGQPGSVDELPFQIRNIIPELNGAARARMIRSSQEKTHVQRLLNSVVPGFRVQKFDKVSSPRLVLKYRVESQEGDICLVTTPPDNQPGVTSEECDAVRSEAALLSWLTLAPVISQPPVAAPSPCSPYPESGEDTVGADVSNRTRAPPTNIRQMIDDYSRPPPPIDAPSGKLLKRPGRHILQAFLPKLVEHGTAEMPGGRHIEYTFTYPVPGNSVAGSPTPLTPRERASVDIQAGQLLRRMSTLLSPTRRFGYAADSLDYPLTRATLVTNPYARLSKGLGFACWSDAFRTMLEFALRDSEDCGLQLPYPSVRSQAERFIPILDRLRNPKLVVIDFATDTNLLIRRKVPIDEAEGIFRTFTESDEENEPNDRIEVTGLCDWSNCIFGDPLIAEVFNSNPSRDFWQGFETPSPGQGADLEPIEDKTYAHVRLLLYDMYHASTIIARENKQCVDKLDAERQARTRLGRAIKKLRDLDDLGQPLHTKPEQDSPVSKRAKMHSQVD